MTSPTWDHTSQEHDIILRRGGRLHGRGFDGWVGGRPVEVRSCRRDDRYRLQQDVHRSLVAGHGSYIFVSPSGRTKTISARRVSVMLGPGRWFRDRVYPHRFLTREEVW